MKKLLSILFLFSCLGIVQAQNVSYNILVERDTTVKARLSGITFGSRDVKYIVYEYPSVDPDGLPVTISGVLMASHHRFDGRCSLGGWRRFGAYQRHAL